MEMIQMSNSGWMDKQIVVFSHNEILLGNKKEQNIDTCSILDQSLENYAE